MEIALFAFVFFVGFLAGKWWDDYVDKASDFEIPLRHYKFPPGTIIHRGQVIVPKYEEEWFNFRITR